jgi:hypothetical protein
MLGSCQRSKVPSRLQDPPKFSGNPSSGSIGRNSSYSWLFILISCATQTGAIHRLSPKLEGSEWKQIPANFKCIRLAVASSERKSGHYIHYILALDDKQVLRWFKGDHDEAYRFHEFKWQVISGGVEQFAVGSDGTVLLRVKDVAPLQLKLK